MQPQRKPPIPFPGADKVRHRAPAQKLLRQIQVMRESMPVLQYVHLMHIAATTGIIPIVNLTTGQFEDRTRQEINRHGELISIQDYEGTFLSASDRISLLQYLVDKILPAAKEIPDTTASSDELAQQVISDPGITKYLTGPELDSLITEATFYSPNTESDHIPDPLNEELT